jgi:hypothetical protein
MSASLPQPLVQSFLVCREITPAPSGGGLALVAPLDGVAASSFPAEIPLAVFAHLTDARGRYEVGLQLVDSDGEVVWTMERPGVVEEPDPLSQPRVTFPDVRVRFPGVGRYDLMFVANGEALAQHALWVREMASP